MAFFIKDEPVEYEENLDNQTYTENSSCITLVEKNFESESFFLKNLQENVFNTKNDEDMELFAEIMKEANQNCAGDLNLVDRRQEISIEKVLSIINVPRKEDEEEESHQIERNLTTKNNKKFEITNAKKLSLKQQQIEKIAFEKKRILASIVESAKEDRNAKTLFNTRYEKLSEKEEKQILSQLDGIFFDDNSELSLREKLDPNLISRLRRFRSKLGIRELKRSKHIKLFDIDSYVNELIDGEKMNDLNRNNQDSLAKVKTETQEEKIFENCRKEVTSEDEDDSIIFEHETLKESLNTDGTNTFEIVAVTRVLDRFNSKRKNNNSSFFCSPTSMRMPVGIVEFRNDDIKCVISPFSQK